MTSHVRKVTKKNAGRLPEYRSCHINTSAYVLRTHNVWKTDGMHSAIAAFARGTTRVAAAYTLLGVLFIYLFIFCKENSIRLRKTGRYLSKALMESNCNETFIYKECNACNINYITLVVVRRNWHHHGCTTYPASRLSDRDHMLLNRWIRTAPDLISPAEGRVGICFQLNTGITNNNKKRSA
jgi:hypothetical protein